MSDWQPAIVNPAHESVWQVPSVLKAAKGRRVRVKPSKNVFAILAYQKDADCDARRFFQVHPDDVPTELKDCMTWILCEHEILTD